MAYCSMREVIAGRGLPKSRRAWAQQQTGDDDRTGAGAPLQLGRCNRDLSDLPCHAPLVFGRGAWTRLHLGDPQLSPRRPSPTARGQKPSDSPTKIACTRCGATTRLMISTLLTPLGTPYAS